MKKLLAASVLLLLIAITYAYLFIPGSVEIINKTTLHGSINAARRIAIPDTAWYRWFPGKKEQANIYESGGFSFKTNRQLFQGAEITAYNTKLKDSGMLLLTPLKNDSFEISWQSKIITGSNPFTRIAAYNEAKKYEQQRAKIFENLKFFLKDESNIYGVSITQQRVTDTFLVSTYSTFDHEPATKEIYDLISKLRMYIAAHNAEAINKPMMHIEPNPNGSFLTRVALPVNKEIPGSGDIEFRFMIKGNILVTNDIRGGKAAIAKAMDGVNDYIKDYGRTSPAIPFELLVTDRMQEPDSSKWITRIYYPIL